MRLDLDSLLDVEGQIRELQRSRLRRYREDVGLSQADVAARLGVSQQAVAKWERENDPGDRWLELAKLYGVTERQPSAPFNPEKRLAWQGARSAGFAARRAA
jgi:DNA-binding XRE family transcriptional regulator